MRLVWTIVLAAVLFSSGIDAAADAPAAAQNTALVVAEPASLLLYGMGLLMLARRLRARR